MGIGDKAEAGFDKVAGKAKETTGKLTDNERLEAEGKADQLKGSAKEGIERVKDSFKKE